MIDGILSICHDNPQILVFLAPGLCKRGMDAVHCRQMDGMLRRECLDTL